MVIRECGHIGKVVICAEPGRAQRICATADTKEVVEVNRPFNYYTFTGRSIGNLHNRRDSLVGGRTCRDSQIIVDTFGPTCIRLNRMRYRSECAGAQQVLDIHVASINRIRVLNGQVFSEALAYLAFSEVPC